VSRWQILYCDPLYPMLRVYRSAEGEESDDVVRFFGDNKRHLVAEISLSVLEEAERNSGFLHEAKVSVRRLS
jgi:hypothetical protein